MWATEESIRHSDTLDLVTIQELNDLLANTFILSDVRGLASPTTHFNQIIFGVKNLGYATAISSTLRA